MPDSMPGMRDTKINAFWVFSALKYSINNPIYSGTQCPTGILSSQFDASAQRSQFTAEDKYLNECGTVERMFWKNVPGKWVPRCKSKESDTNLTKMDLIKRKQVTKQYLMRLYYAVSPKQSPTLEEFLV